ncbi:MAG: dockerin type I domain-containing protein [Planctomycetota bacterium]
MRWVAVVTVVTVPLMYAGAGAAGKRDVASSPPAEPEVIISDVRTVAVLDDELARSRDRVDGLGSGESAAAPIQSPEACCLGDGRCVDTPVGSCAAQQGDPQGPGTNCLGTPVACSAHKWAQPPVPGATGNVFYGWDQHSVWDYKLEGPSSIVADDWVCDSTAPVSDIHWWGSYVGWKGQLPPGSLQQPPVDHFHILFWDDVPAGTDQAFSHPGKVLWEIVRTVPGTNETFVGWDINPATGQFESTFRYDLDLNPAEWFYQAPSPAPAVYWVTIAACYEPNPIGGPFPWGWKTRPRDPTSRAPDAAVNIFEPWWAVPGSTYVRGEPICWPGPSPCPVDSQWDMAFELTSKMPLGVFKWLQRPDTATAGMDVHATTPYVLADDFPCTITSDISQVTIWGSFYRDVFPGSPGDPGTGPGNLWFRLSFHNDVPAGQNPDPSVTWSTPGILLWTRTFAPGEFIVGPCGTDLLEGWFEPPGFYDPFGDTMCFAYTFLLNPLEFVQRGTPDAQQIYWLDVEAFPPTAGSFFGWKTSVDHWNDDGVWNVFGMPPPGPWQELRNPPGHPSAGQSMDLAFELAGTVYEETLKWSQPPAAYDQCFRGWNEFSVYGGQWIVADDWPCETNRPITDIHWWGSYLGWDRDLPPVDGPDGFHIGIWTDVPFMPPGFSHPGEMLREWFVSRFMLNERAVGCDAFEAAIAPETCFKYDWSPDVVLFEQPDATCSVYWVSIAAHYPNFCACHGDLDGDGIVDARDLAILTSCFALPPTGVCERADINCDGSIGAADLDAFNCLFGGGLPEQCCPGTTPILPANPWGWKTREHIYMDDAVRMFAPTRPGVGSYFEMGEAIQSPAGVSWDMAFVLTSPVLNEGCCFLMAVEPVCQDLPPTQCQGMAGIPQGPGTVCSAPANWEACCTPDGTCRVIDPLCCNDLGGTALGPGSVCGGELNACCLTDGTCVMADPTCCPLLGGIAQGPFSECTAAEACCMNDGSCRDLDPLCCRELGGVPQGVGTGCVDTLKACCLQDGSGNCKDVDPVCCDDIGGTPSPIGAPLCLGDQNGTGVDDACEVLAQACCLPEGRCVEVEYAKCVALGGDPQGPNTICDMRICNPLKWAQPPTYGPTISPSQQCFWGWDQLSHYQCCEIVADDWACDSNQPVTDVHWWGSYWNWTTREAPPPTPDFPQLFHIGIWKDVPAGLDRPFSHPGTMIWQALVPRAATNERWVGCDEYPGMPPDACFRYDFQIPESEWFYQTPSTDPTIYWISIAAWYMPGPPQIFPWGWKTREHFFNDDAVVILDPNMPVPGMEFRDGRPLETPDGVSWDMAFVLTTQTPGRTKWEQWPKPTLPGLHAHDGIVLADNWECTGGKITDFHWWGNYELGDQGNEERGAGILCMNLSLHANRPGGPWCVPMDPPLWGVCALFDPLGETFTGMINSEGSKIYRYDFEMTPAHNQIPGEIYWLNIEAIPMDPREPALWRWQEAARNPVPRLCPAAQKGMIPEWMSITWAEDPPLYTDLAFAVTSTLYKPRPDMDGVDKNRYVSFVVPPENAGQPMAMRVALTSLQRPYPPNIPQYPPQDFSAYEGQYRYVQLVRNELGNPVTDCQDSIVQHTSFKCAMLGCTPEYRDWAAELGGAVLHVTGAEVVPSSAYDVTLLAASCAGVEATCGMTSAPLTINTARWADVAPGYQPIPPPPPPPPTQPNVLDIAAEVDKVKDLPTGTYSKPQMQLQANVPNPRANVNVLDIANAVDAVKNKAYPFSGPCACPSAQPCSPANFCGTHADCASPRKCVGGACVLLDACERCAP